MGIIWNEGEKPGPVRVAAGDDQTTALAEILRWAAGHAIDRLTELKVAARMCDTLPPGEPVVEFSAFLGDTRLSCRVRWREGDGPGELVEGAKYLTVKKNGEFLIEYTCTPDIDALVFGGEQKPEVSDG
jgi:hypothetical protein